VVAPAVLLFNPGAAVSGRLLSEVLIVIVTVILAQGYLHQVVLIRKTGLTGAVALRMHQFFLLKDISTLVFALTMGMAAGWPLLLLSTVSAITKLITIWHFRWVRLSPIARERRNTPSSGTPETLLALG
jgi:hypothetical protein